MILFSFSSSSETINWGTTSNTVCKGKQPFSVQLLLAVRLLSKSNYHRIGFIRQKSSVNCTQVPEKTVKKLKQMWSSGLLSLKMSLCSCITWEPTSACIPLGTGQSHGERERFPNPQQLLQQLWGTLSVGLYYHLAKLHRLGQILFSAVLEPAQ